MILFFFSLIYSQTIKCEEIDTELTFTSTKLKKGEKICIRAKLPNLLIITNYFENIKINYAVTTSVTEDYKIVGNLSPSPYFFFNDFATLFFTTDEEESLLSFTAVTVPDECKNHVWYTNVPLTNFSIGDSISNEIAQTIRYDALCLFFSTNEVQEFSISFNLPNENDKLSIGSDVYHGPDASFPFKAYRKQYFIVHFDEKSSKNRKIIIRSINKDSLKPSFPGSGFIESERTIEEHQSLSIIMYLGIFLIFIISIVYLVKKYFNGIDLSVKYEGLKDI